MDIEVAVATVGETSAMATARQHTVRIDRPTAKGGSDSGAMGGELLLAALGGCFMSNLQAALGQEGFATGPDDVQLGVIGTLASAPARFETIRVEVRVRPGMDLPPETLAKCITKARRGCIVHNTLGSGARVTVTDASELAESSSQ
ncbi:OsmC family protein [Flexivirga aerilata]|nr:OsmC family protein [Flexivirga aerilata]